MEKKIENLSEGINNMTWEKTKQSKHEFYAWCDINWSDVGLPEFGKKSNKTDEEIINIFCFKNNMKIIGDWVYRMKESEECGTTCNETICFCGKI